MLSQLEQLDQQLFLWLNGHHSPFWDPIWGAITGKLTFIPLYLLLMGYLLWRHRWQGLVMIVVMVVAVVAADQFTSAFMKPFFARPRPCHEPNLAGLVHTLNHCGGKYGFASSHAANTFALATFAWLLLRKNLRWIWLAFVWAAIVSYSRIYVGVHYPADIMIGGTVGAILGWWGYWGLRRMGFAKG